MLKINEIFYSIQGEGFNTGIPTIFIRLSGCNLKCEWCDTSHFKYTEMSRKDIIKKLKKYPSKTVVITGGEPLLQNITDLLYELVTEGYTICIETNGTCEITAEQYLLLDFITVSPKHNQKVIQHYGNELKLVYVGQDIKKYESLFFDYFYLQPCSMKNTSRVIKIVKDNPKWRLSIQCQKILKIR